MAFHEFKGTTNSYFTFMRTGSDVPKKITFSSFYPVHALFHHPQMGNINQTSKSKRLKFERNNGNGNIRSLLLQTEKNLCEMENSLPPKKRNKQKKLYFHDFILYIFFLLNHISVHSQL